MCLLLLETDSMTSMATEKPPVFLWLKSVKKGHGLMDKHTRDQIIKCMEELTKTARILQDILDADEDQEDESKSAAPSHHVSISYLITNGKITARTALCLERHGIHTLNEILDLSKEELLAIRNMRKKQVCELGNLLQEELGVTRTELFCI